LSFVGYLTRGVAFALVGVVVGRLVEAQRAARELHDHFFALSRDLFCVANHEGYFVLVNAAWERLLGYREEELLARPYTDFIHPDDLAGTVAEAERLAEGLETVEFANRYRAKDGSYHWLEWAARASSETGLIYADARPATARRRREDELRSLAYTDPLTSLLTRRRFDQALSEELARSQADGGTPALLLVDIDNFKQINDRFGHQAGDRVLVELAGVLRANARETDLLARLGGDEFALLLPETSPAEATAVAERLVRAAEQHWSPPQEVRATLSIGVAAPHPDRVDLDPAKLYQRADKALYEVKRARRNSWALSA